jgi:hypothetical protein
MHRVTLFAVAKYDDANNDDCTITGKSRLHDRLSPQGPGAAVELPVSGRPEIGCRFRPYQSLNPFVLFNHV